MYEDINEEFIDDGIDCGRGEKLKILINMELDTIYYVRQFNWNDEIRKEFFDQIEAAFLQQGGYMRKCDKCGRPYPCFPTGSQTYSCQNPECLDWHYAETKVAISEYAEEVRNREVVDVAPTPLPSPEYQPPEQKTSFEAHETKSREKVLYDRPVFIAPRKKLKPCYIKDRRRTPTQEQRDFVMKRDGEICQYCGEPGEALDHVLPFAHGGRTVLSNLVCSCQRCNSMLKDKVFGSYVEKRTWIMDKLGI